MLFYFGWLVALSFYPTKTSSPILFKTSHGFSSSKLEDEQQNCWISSKTHRTKISVEIATSQWHHHDIMHDITMTSSWHHHDIIHDIIDDIIGSHHMTSSWHHRWHHRDTCHLVYIYTWQVSYTSVQSISRQHIQCICIHTSFILV